MHILAIPWAIRLYRNDKLSTDGSLVLPTRFEWWPIITEFQSCGSVTILFGDRPLHLKKKEAIKSQCKRSLALIEST